MRISGCGSGARPGRSGRTGIVEELAVRAVVLAEVIDVHEERRQIDQIRELRAFRRQHVAQVFDARARLRGDVELGRTHGVDRRADEGIVRPARAEAGNEQEVTTAFDVRVRAARFGPAGNESGHEGVSLKRTGSPSAAHAERSRTAAPRRPRHQAGVERSALR